MKSKVKEELDKAAERLLTNMGKMTQLSLLPIGAHHVFGLYQSRREYLRRFTNKEIEGYAIAFPDLQKSIEKYGIREGYWRWARGRPLKVKRLINQLSVVFLVAAVESYLSEIIMIALKNKPKCLCCDKTISWDNVIKLKKYDSIINQFTFQKTNEIMSGDWKDISNKLRKTFNISPGKGLDDKKMLEVFEIRHVIVHSSGIADSKFINKVKGSAFRIKYEMNKEIILNQRNCEGIMSYCYDAMMHIQNEIEDLLEIK